MCPRDLSVCQNLIRTDPGPLGLHPVSINMRACRVTKIKPDCPCSATLWPLLGHIWTQRFWNVKRLISEAAVFSSPQSWPGSGFWPQPRFSHFIHAFISSSIYSQAGRLEPEPSSVPRLQTKSNVLWSGESGFICRGFWSNFIYKKLLLCIFQLKALYIKIKQHKFTIKLLQ